MNLNASFLQNNYWIQYLCSTCYAVRLCFISGFSIWHFTLDIAAVYMFVVVLGPTLVTVTLTWILTLVSNCFVAAY